MSDGATNPGRRVQDRRDHFAKIAALPGQVAFLERVNALLAAQLAAKTEALARLEKWVGADWQCEYSTARQDDNQDDRPALPACLEPIYDRFVKQGD